MRFCPPDPGFGLKLGTEIHLKMPIHSSVPFKVGKEPRLANGGLGVRRNDKRRQQAGKPLEFTALLLHSFLNSLNSAGRVKEIEPSWLLPKGRTVALLIFGRFEWEKS